jgi:hypothetical protein
MNKLVETKYGLPTQEAENIYRAAQEDAGFEKMMKFRKGHYYVDGDEVPLGTVYTAHCVGWTKCWIKFEDGKVAPENRRIYRMLKGETPPDRTSLGDMDMSKWPISENTKAPMDPWVQQYLLPLEAASGEIHIFVTSSFGGKRAVADVCSAWSRKNIKDPASGQPIVRIREVMMPSKKWGEIPRPHFEIIGWDGVRPAIREVDPDKLGPDHDAMSDAIPF